MLGYIEFDDSTGAARLAQHKILGGTFLVLNLGRSARGLLKKHRAARAARNMWEQNVRSAVFPVDFPYTSIFIRQGILPVDPLPLRRTLCASFVRRRLEELKVPFAQAVVAVVGEHMSREVAETAKALALSFRYVLLSVPSGGEEFARSLRREYGVSLLLKPSPDQLERADALVLFTPRCDLRRENKVLCTLYPGGEIGRGRLSLRLSGELSGKVAPNCDQEQLAAALHRLGVLTEDMLIPDLI